MAAARTTPAPAARLWRAVAIAIDAALCASALCWFAGRFVGDTRLSAQWLAYFPGLPLALLAGAWLLVRRRRARPLRAALLAFLALVLADFLAFEVRWHPAAPPGPGDLKMVHWNIARGRGGTGRVLDTLAREAPDLLVLSELPRDADFTGAVARATGLGHVCVLQGLLIAARNPIHVREGRVDLRNARGWSAEVEHAGGRLRILLVDVQSRPDLDRLPMGQDVAAWVARQPAEVPLLVVGDFNTPRRAGSLIPLRAHLRQAYEEAGRGWPFSWPLPFPCYALDHIWMGPGVNMVSFRYRFGLASDHLRQVGWLRLAVPPAPHGPAAARPAAPDPVPHS